MLHAGTTLGANLHTKLISFPRSRELPATLGPDAEKTRMSPASGSHSCRALCFGLYPEESDPMAARRPPNPVRHLGRGCRAPPP
jgi:hypothetical protein